MAAKRKSNPTKIIIIALVIIIAVALIIHFNNAGKEEPTIRTAKVERGTMTASVSANGTLQPLTTVEVKSNVGGQVMQLLVDEGDEVKPGQVIAKIDPTDSSTAYDQSQADLAAANSKVEQARQQLTMQHQQNQAQIASATQALEAAKTKLEQAEAQANTQPILTRANIKQAENNYQSALATLNQTKSALVPQKLASAQAAYDQAQASYSSAEKDYARQKELLAKGFVAKSQVDSSEEKYKVTKAQLDSARRKSDTIKDETDQDLHTAQARLEQAQAELENAKANKVQDKIKQQDVATARAAVKQAQASLNVARAAAYQDEIGQGNILQAKSSVKRFEAAYTNAKTQLNYTTVTAPRAGIVTKKYVEAGSIVTAGKSSFSGSGSGVGIVDIADVSRMFVLVNVDETDIASIEINQKVDVTIEAYPDEVFEGKVTKIAPQSVTEQNVTTIPVTVEIDLPDARLKPGMNATCDFITGRSEDVLMVASEAVSETDNGGYTVTVMENGKQVKKTVEIGLVGTDNTEIKKGLKEGDTVVTAIIQPTSTTSSSSSSKPGGMMGGPGGFGRGMR